MRSVLRHIPSRDASTSRSIGRGIRTAETRAPAELLRHARDRERRTIGIAVQIDIRRFAHLSETADGIRD